MAKIGSSQKPPLPTSTGRRLGGAKIQEAVVDSVSQESTAIKLDSSTREERIKDATAQGGLIKIPASYEDGNDWVTVNEEDPFTQLYLCADLYDKISDDQVTANLKTLTNFWEKKRILLITGNKHLEETYGKDTIPKSKDRLEKAAAVLADANGRKACYNEINKRRLQKASADMALYMEHQLANQLMLPKAIKLAVAEGEKKGFRSVEAEDYVLVKMRDAGFAPVKTINQSPNLLLSTWTPEGRPVTGRPHTKVLGHDVYSLAEAGKALQDAFTSGDDKALRYLDSQEYLSNLARDLKENDTLLDIEDIFQNSKLTQRQRRLSLIYLYGPDLPFFTEGLTEPFLDPDQLFVRIAKSAVDFAIAEKAFKAGELQIWIQAAAKATIKALLPNKKTTLEFRKFLHQVNPQFPLWIGEASFSNLVQLADFIKRDEGSWKLVYGSLNAGNIEIWLNAIKQSSVLDKKSEILKTLVRTEEIDSELGQKLTVQALLEALKPSEVVPSLEADFEVVNLTGLSGETQVERVINVRNKAGGYVQVLLELHPPLDGITLSETEIFFDQRAPGQQISVTITGDPAQMSRNGINIAQLKIQTAYAIKEIAIQTEAVFPMKEFLSFVGLTALAFAFVFGGARFLLSLMINKESSLALLSLDGLLPMAEASRAGDGPGFILITCLLSLLGLTFLIVYILFNLSKKKEI